MGLFDNDDTTKMEEKDAEIARLRQQLAAKSSKESKVVLRDEDESEDESIKVRGVSVTIKHPLFNETNPELWFLRAESQFVSKGITSDTTKFHHLYALLTDKAANEIEALLLDPPKTGKVAAMRTKLVRRFGRSQYDKDTELLNTRSLGDMTPSQMWSKFQRLNKDPSTFVRAYLINMYPPEVRGALANMKFESNDEMAAAADRYIENARKKPTEVNSVEEQQVMEDSAGQVNAISRGRGQAGRGRGQAGGQRSAGPTGQSGKTCFFHDRHGLGAFKCGGPPCPFASAPLAPKSGNATAGR